MKAKQNHFRFRSHFRGSCLIYQTEGVESVSVIGQQRRLFLFTFSSCSEKVKARAACPDFYRELEHLNEIV
ncbi:MAG: hypothetical protein JEZ14_19775 [Marinilabiliaceae bacterium]|nr:hypothetical protein [Marinilabiliaceae bacterium]